MSKDIAARCKKRRGAKMVSKGREGEGRKGERMGREVEGEGMVRGRGSAVLEKKKLDNVGI